MEKDKKRCERTALRRAIKFRGKSVDTHEWVYGDFCEPCNVVFEVGPEGDEFWDDHSVDEKTVGQFTGLFDKDGNEVYEGDIFEFVWIDGHGKKRQVNHYKVVWNQRFARFEPVCVDEKDRWALYDLIVLSKSKIIGNIFDNPELVKRAV